MIIFYLIDFYDNLLKVNIFNLNIILLLNDSVKVFISNHFSHVLIVGQGAHLLEGCQWGKS